MAVEAVDEGLRYIAVKCGAVHRRPNMTVMMQSRSGDIGETARRVPRAVLR